MAEFSTNIAIEMSNERMIRVAMIIPVAMYTDTLLLSSEKIWYTTAS